MKYREGWIGALLDEYELAITMFLNKFKLIENLDEVVDKDTEDEDCRSYRSICNHTINAGYGYIHYLRNAYLQGGERKRVSIEKGSFEGMIGEMFRETERTCNELRSIPESQLTVTFDAPWGQKYDAEQMLEHAVMHVHRHRRQVSRFQSTVSSSR